MEISIIGGGIGGLSLANALKSMGIKFHLYERSTKFTEVGAGIGLSESTLQILDKIGLYNLAKSNGKFIERAILANKNLKTLRVIPTESEGMCIDRTKLIEILSANISEDEYTLNEELESFQRKEGKMMMNFSSGKKVETELIIACDGINSKIRGKIYPQIQKRYSGQTIWRGISYLELPENFQNTYYELWGDNLRFGVSPMIENRYYWYAVKMAPAKERENPNESRTVLKKLFKNYSPKILKIIENSPKIVRDDMWDLKPHNNSWCQDNLVFLGDSIHATTPNLAQGGCQAIEDAYTLAKAIKKFGLSKEAFKKYEEVRREKTTYIVNKSWQFGKSAHSRIPFLVDINAFFIKYLVPNSFFLNQYKRLTDLKYLEEI